ncbi:MAG: manganese/zinc/iron transport system permease protein [Glaciecola sp.]|jgi:manganese/zinc/iron transport system permease protein
MFDFWIILTACLVAINSSVLGSFLVLKRMSMLGDALSHSVLPGIVIAFLITGEHSSILTTLFSAALGLFAVFIMNILSKKGGFQKDAAIGIMYTFLFSIGIILISSFARNADIDVECVLFGDIGNIPFTKGITIMGLEVPKQTFLLLLFTVVNTVIVFLGIKGFSIVSFDPLLAGTIGVSIVFWDYLLLGLTSLSTVFSFESVGAIMVISMLVIPAGFANLLTKRIKPFITLAMIFSVICSVSGYYLAFLLNVNIVACISCVMGVILLVTVFGKKSINQKLN